MEMHPSDKGYIDIHTHHLSGEDNVFRIFNVHLEDFGKGVFQVPVSTGLHPWHTDKYGDVDELARILGEAADRPGVVAIGETGIDRSIPAGTDRQEEVFRLHASISKETGKPLIIHCVKAFQEILRVKKETASSAGWILHGFNSSPQMAEELVSHGFFISFGKRLLMNEAKSREILRRIPLQKVFAETDDQEDMPIGEIYERLAGLKKIALPELQKQVRENYWKISGT